MEDGHALVGAEDGIQKSVIRTFIHGSELPEDNGIGTWDAEVQVDRAKDVTLLSDGDASGVVGCGEAVPTDV
jgi:hypothetical protein